MRQICIFLTEHINNFYQKLKLRDIDLSEGIDSDNIIKLDNDICINLANGVIRDVDWIKYYDALSEGTLEKVVWATDQKNIRTRNIILGIAAIIFGAIVIFAIDFIVSNSIFSYYFTLLYGGRLAETNPSIIPHQFYKSGIPFIFGLISDFISRSIVTFLIIKKLSDFRLSFTNLSSIHLYKTPLYKLVLLSFITMGYPSTYLIGKYFPTLYATQFEYMLLLDIIRMSTLVLIISKSVGEITYMYKNMYYIAAIALALSGIVALTSFPLPYDPLSIFVYSLMGIGQMAIALLLINNRLYFGKLVSRKIADTHLFGLSFTSAVLVLNLMIVIISHHMNFYNLAAVIISASYIGITIAIILKEKQLGCGKLDKLYFSKLKRSDR